MKKCIIAGILCLAFFSFAAPFPANASDKKIEKASYLEIKAAFLLNILRYTTWPDSAFASADSSFLVCVFDDRRFADTIKSLTKNRKVKNRKMEISSSSNIEDLADCHALYIASRNPKEVEKILSRISQKNTLTFSDYPGLAEKGIGVNFYRLDHRLRFEINLSSIRKFGLSMSSKLLSLAKIVQAAGGEDE